MRVQYTHRFYHFFNEIFFELKHRKMCGGLRIFFERITSSRSNSICNHKTRTTMSDRKKLYCEKRYIKNRSVILADERLDFMGGERLGDVPIGIEDNATRRKIRRILEKRVAQHFWRNAATGKKQGNGARYQTRHHLSNHFKNIYGFIPSGFRYCA